MYALISSQLLADSEDKLLGEVILYDTDLL